MKFNEFLKQQLEDDPKLKKEYEALAPEYEIISAMIEARTEQHLTQKELSEKTGIPQAHISRIECGNYNPSLKMLKRIAAGLGRELHIEFRRSGLK